MLQKYEQQLELIAELEIGLLIFRSFEAVNRLRCAKQELRAMRDLRLKRFSDKQLQLRLQKLAVQRSEAISNNWLLWEDQIDAESFKIIQELHIRNLIREYQNA